MLCKVEVGRGATSFLINLIFVVEDVLKKHFTVDECNQDETNHMKLLPFKEKGQLTKSAPVHSKRNPAQVNCATFIAQAVIKFHRQQEANYILLIVLPNYYMAYNLAIHKFKIL